MAVWRDIATSETDTDSPVTNVLMDAYRQNVIAALEGAAGAPKPALKSLIGSFTTGNLDFNSIGVWSGVWFSLTARNSSGSTTRTLLFDATDDGGSSHLGAVTIYALPASSEAQIIGFFDFATGVVHGTIMSSGATPNAVTFSQTVPGASLSIDGVRFKGATDITAGAMIHPNGGESAT